MKGIFRTHLPHSTSDAFRSVTVAHPCVCFGTSSEVPTTFEVNKKHWQRILQLILNV